MPEQEQDELRIGGQTIDVEIVEPLNSGGVRVDLEVDDRKWRVDVTKTGSKKAIVTTWRDGQLADLDEPDWLEDALSMLARSA